jgi:outer membrane protein assembly factor BamB
MKKMLPALLVLLATFAAVHAQAPYKIYTSPKLPARDALERMNLTLAWNTRVTVDGQRDGIASVQLIPGKSSQLVVQTLKGAVFLYDANTGDLIWKTAVGVPYWTSQPAGFNSQSIFVTRRNILYVLNRFDGSQRVFTYDPSSKSNYYGYQLAFGPNAAPSADEDFLYFPMGNRVHAIYIPDFETIDRVRRRREARRRTAKDEEKADARDEKGVMPDDDIPDGPDSPQPVFYWGYSLADQLTISSPLIYGEQVSILTTNGVLTSVNRFEKGPRIENFEFKTTGRVRSAAGQHLEVAYLASDDFNLYAVNMKSGELIWRYISGAPLVRQPLVNDRDIYIAPEGIGLRRIDRISGREFWTNRDTHRFLAANLAYVYALDQIGKFFVLDAQRGSTLAKLDLSDWTIPLANEWTDRIYLAAHDGQIICLRHRELPKPLNLKTQDVPVAKDIKKPQEEKKDDKGKDKEKDKDDKDKEKDKDKGAVKTDRLQALPPRIQVSARYEMFPHGQDDTAARDETRTRAQR